LNYRILWSSARHDMGPIIIYIMGVSGSGKTTIGKKLSDRTGIPFFDGDDFHLPEKVEKMRRGEPLTDSDRSEWLAKINAIAREQATNKGALIACSALKENYRKVLTSELTAPVFWVFLRGSFETIEKRMKLRTDHFMPTALLASQFEALEMPTRAITVDIDDDPDKIVERIISRLRLPS
jgi:carbohydrate kinase (thermoresistant glucokinase family)